MTKVLAFLILAMVTGLLGHPSPDKNVHQHQRHEQIDPNSGRASRLLYSPRSRALSNNNVPDMHTALRRLRESQQMTLGDRQTNSANINHEQQNDMEPLSGNGTQNSDDDERSLKEMCHAKILQKCGSAVIEGFAENNLPLYQKCRIRENFLHCVIKMKRRTCHKRSREDLLMTDDYIRSLRQQILTLLWSARGCVLGMEATQ